MLHQPEGSRKFDKQRVEVPLQRMKIGAAELAEIGDGHHPRRSIGAKQGRAGGNPYRIGTGAAQVGVPGRKIKSDECRGWHRRLATPFKAAKRRQIRNVGVAWPAAREPVLGKGTQTIDQGNDPAEDEKVAASHGHTTVTGVPTGTCS